MKTKPSYILLGSNINPHQNIRLAINKLHEKFKVAKISKVYETKPIKKSDVNNYLNAVVEIITDLDPLTIKYEYLRKIEQEMGRVRTEDKFKPRVIDLDLILCRDMVFSDSSANLELPDPEILEFGHIALPLADLVPNYQLPKYNITVQEVSNQFRDNPVISEVTL